MPTINAKDQIEIHASAAAVYGVVADYENISEWLPVYSCTYINGNELQEGLQVAHQYGKPPFVMSKFTRVIDKIVPGERLEETYSDGDLRGSGSWSFEPSQTGTIVSYECHVASHTWFPHITFTLFGKHAHSNVYKPLLKKLKAHCEAL